MTLDAFLKFMDDDLSREWTHLKFYLYHSAAIAGLHAAEYREFFTKAAQGEMEHVQQFLDRLYGLNYLRPTQSAASFPVTTDVVAALEQAIKLESEVVKNYTTRLKQLETLGDETAAAYLTIFYENQLEDSYEDCERMRRLLAKLR